jgi:hypothetical protein
MLASFLVKDEQDSALNNTSVAKNDPVIKSFSKFYFPLGLSLLSYYIREFWSPLVL